MLHDGTSLRIMHDLQVEQGVSSLEGDITFESLQKILAAVNHPQQAIPGPPAGPQEIPLSHQYAHLGISGGPLRPACNNFCSQDGNVPLQYPQPSATRTPRQVSGCSAFQGESYNTSQQSDSYGAYDVQEVQLLQHHPSQLYHDIQGGASQRVQAFQDQWPEPSASGGNSEQHFSISTMPNSSSRPNPSWDGLDVWQPGKEFEDGQHMQKQDMRQRRVDHSVQHASRLPQSHWAKICWYRVFLISSPPRIHEWASLKNRHHLENL